MGERSAQVQEGRLAAMGKKLDLSKLTDEEAKHIWQVIQRDFDLRKKEDDRLGQLKSQIKKEDVKRELLGEQTSLTNSYCIRCLQPFRFLVNSKCQCRDCGLYTCKACSRYHKKERGWVCDPCRLSRVVKMGTLDWYHEHVQSRFKRFGSAKVMRSLYRRQHGSGQSLHPEFFALQDEDTLSMPENHGFDLCDAAEGGDSVIDASEAQHYKMMRKKKRLLSVHPLDFDLDSEYSAQSRRESFQYTSGLDAVTPKEPAIAEADVTSMFQQILEEQRQQGEEEPATELQLHGGSQNSPASLTSHPPRSRYSADMDTSDEEPEARFPVYQSHFHHRRSRESPPEGEESTPQIPCGVKDTVQPTQRPSPPSQDQRLGNEAGETRQQLDAHVSDIESRIAALHAAGMSVSTQEESRKKTLKQTSTGEEVMPKALFKAARDQCKTNTFDRNDVYRSSLTQRNPSSRTKRSPVYAKPVMAHHT
ncbi:melanophilin-like isoform X6 [Polypterus senegalus]|uniref:melanophilin-like isoform X6 n=1 Tax=Polypterus senegalus TaxID=55291 RepID=UPI0019664AF5|nr:melanophilin-like isoform X6 [Polypterus senegalus]